MLKLAFIGYRGMVGSILIDRMIEENDFNNFRTFFFSSSQIGKIAPKVPNSYEIIQDSFDINKLLKMDIILTCQGSEYTKKVYNKLYENGYKGFFIDASSYLRMKENSIIVLDVINKNKIINAIKNNIKTFVGGNCTVSLLLLALHGLIKDNLIEWVSSMTYQAISGSGARAMEELLTQQEYLLKNTNKDLSILEKEKNFKDLILKKDFPKKNTLEALAMNILSFIDCELKNGQSKEEWKAQIEANKILETKENNKIKIDGTCVRINSLRCHSQALLIKLKDNLEISEIEKKLKNANKWVEIIPNKKSETLKYLTPMNISGTLKIAVGRIRKTNIGENYINIFTVGDQLLWGAAEPLRRTLNIINKNL